MPKFLQIHLFIIIHVFLASCPVCSTSVNTFNQYPLNSTKEIPVRKSSNNYFSCHVAYVSYNLIKLLATANNHSKDYDIRYMNYI